MVKSTEVETIPGRQGKIIHAICRPGVQHGLCSLKNKTKMKSCLALAEAIPEHALPGRLLVSSCLVIVPNQEVSTMNARSAIWGNAQNLQKLN